MAYRNPKYRYGLLETPESSDFGDETTLQTSTISESTFHKTIEIAGPSARYSSDKNTPKCNDVFVAKRKITETDTSGGKRTPNNLMTSRNFTDATTLLASDEASSTSSGSKATTPGPVFQAPSGLPPRRVQSMSNMTPRTPLLSTKNRTPSTFNMTKSTPKRSLAQSSGHRSTPKSTPRSRSTPKVSDTPRNNDPSNIVTIVEGRGLARGEIGMASIDLKNPVLTLSQFSDSQTYVKTMTKLQILSPIEIVFPSTMCDNGNMAQVFKFVNDNFQNSNITTVQRHYFNEGNGLDMIKRLVMKENSSVIMDVTSKYYCLAASAALIKYVEFVQNTIYASESLRILFKGSEQTTLIDAGTSTVLELTTNLNNPKSDHSLFGMLNRTKTQGGARLLRSNILQPPNDVETIQGRLDIVEELSNSSEIFFGMQSVLARFEIDIDHLLSSLVQIPKQETDKTREHHMTTAILLKHVTELVPALCETLSEGKCELFQAYKTSLQDARYGCINDMISRTMHVDARYTKGHLSMKTQRCFAVKQGLHGVLDLSRVTYTELIEDINQLISQQAEKHGLPLKSAYTVSRGFHIQVATKSVQDLPEEFIKVSKTKSTYSFTTEDLIRLNNKVEISIKDINLLSDALIADLLVEVRTCIGCLYNLSEIVSTLDMLMSFAHVRTITDCVRPEFTDTLAIKNGRHPVLDRILPEVVPNNVYAADGTNFSIITGPNMSGKSTYLKMIALLQIVAQIGCFVPAEFASFRIADQIFSRIGSDDDMETNSSTFVLEMKEINYILQNCRANSLIIIDELGRGTSSEEGVGLCWAISEFLLVQKSFTFFATHFLELCRLESIYPNVENYHLKIQHIMTTRGSLRKVSYTYVLTKGHTEEKHYGLQLAELFNFPSIMMSQAREIATRIQERSDASDAVTTAERKRDNADYRFATKLLQAARSSKLSSEALKDYLKSLREEYKKEIGDDTPTPHSKEAPPKYPQTPKVPLKPQDDTSHHRTVAESGISV